MKRYFKVLKGHSKTFSASWSSKNRLLRSRLSEDLSGWVALKTHNLPSGRLKKRLWWKDEAIFNVSKAFRNWFPASRASKIWLERSRFNDVLSRRIALITNNLPSGRLIIRLLWSLWRVVLRCWKAMWNQIVNPGHWKKRLLLSTLSDVLSRRMGLRTHTLPSGRLNKRLWCSRWSDVSRCPKATRNLILLLGHRNSDFYEVA
jgi:hypothetical protein